jgi:hypothetical protein
MKKILLYFLIILQFIFSTAAKAQSSTVKGHDIIIHISAVTSVISSNFKVDIYKAKGKIKIVYAMFDSLKTQQLNKDTSYIHAEKEARNYNVNKPGNYEAIIKLGAIIEHYYVYDRDSVLLSTKADTAYAHLLDRIVTTSKEDLERKEINKNRIVLDGTQFRCEIITQSVTTIAQAHSPSEKSHPLLHDLIVQSFNKYRERKGAAFFKNRTVGY